MIRLEFTILALSALLSLALALVTIVASLRQFGGAAVRSSRENYASPVGLAGRAERAHANHNGALLPFAAALVAAALTGRLGNATASAAQLFFAARLAHASLYLADVPILRSLAYYVGVAATAAVAGELL